MGCNGVFRRRPCPEAEKPSRPDAGRAGNGLLTPEEFDAKKAELLARI
jgi:hypothetical protein